MEYHQFSNEETTLLYQRIINAENILAKLEREHKSQVEFLNQELGNQKTLIDANRGWIQICDKSIKEFRTQLNIITNAKLAVLKPLEAKTPKKWWKF